MMKSPTFRLASAVLCCALASSGCMDFEGFDQAVELRTHVDDWRDQVIYQILVDRFADGDPSNNFDVRPGGPARWHGGDWAGVEQQLPYLHDLGVTALWISPVYRNVETDAGVDGYHGYWPQDFNATNPHFGDVMALRRMVKAAHERNMLVIIDVVTNHVGQLFYYDINLNGQPDERVLGSGSTSPVEHLSEYDPDFDPRGVQAFTSLGEAGPAPIIFQYDPLTRHLPPMPPVLQKAEMYNRRGRTLDFEDPDQLLHGDFPGGLKDLDTTRCEVKEAMVDSYARWIELTDADGFRIDTVKHVEREFWRYFTQKVRQRLADGGKQRFFMFGEAFDGRPELVGTYTKNDQPSMAQQQREASCVTDGRALTGDQLDAMFHFPQYYQVFRDVFQLGLSTDRIETLWQERSLHYGDEAVELGSGVKPIEALVNFIDNHDVPRFLFHDGDVEALHAALVLLMTEQGIPCLYYGTEQQFEGGNDPANREDLWLSGYDTGATTFQWIKRLTTLRKQHAALRRGEQRVVWASARAADEPDAGIFAFERELPGESYALVVLNTHKTQASAPVFQGQAMIIAQSEGSELVDVLSAARTRYTVGPGGGLAIELGSREAAILVPAEQAN